MSTPVPHVPEDEDDERGGDENEGDLVDEITRIRLPGIMGGGAHA